MNPGFVALVMASTPSVGRRYASATTIDRWGQRQKVGGAGRDRTGDLRLAKAALSQLSYSPERIGGPKWI
jgi:hypothetical protein